MFLGRVGVIGYYAHKNRENSKQKREPYLVKHKKEFLQKIGKQKFLIYTDYPIAAWILGTIMMISGAGLTYLVSLGKYNSLFSEFHEGFWWQYLISVSILLLGFSFLVGVDAEKVEFLKQIKTIIVCKWNLLGKNKYVGRDLTTLEDILIYKRGHESKANNTIHYIIKLTFQKDRSIEILENSNRIEIKKKFVEINTFIEKNFDIEKIRIIDESTTVAKKSKQKTELISENEVQTIEKENNFSEETMFLNETQTSLN